MASTTFIRPPTVARPARAEQPADVRWMRLTAHGLFALAGVLFAVLALNLLIRQPVFSLRAIRVDGDLTRNSVATIRVNAVPHLRGNFFTIDLQAARRAFETVPWVRHAVVQRVWPNRLAVRLEEHRPVALWRQADDNGIAEQLVNAQGEVFEANVGDVESDKLPTLEGPEGSSAAMLTMLTRLQPVFTRQGSHIDTLRQSGRASWEVELDTGATVVLGRGSDDEVLTRADRYVSTVTQMTQLFQAPVVYADLRHRDGYALRLRGVATVTAPGAANKN